MARIAFDVDDKIKQEIRMRLVKERQTLSFVMRRFCDHYKNSGLLNLRLGQKIDWEKRGALPDVPAVYFIQDRKQEIQYIGQTESLRTRLASHHRGHQFAKMYATIFWVEAPADVLIGLESSLIEIIEPILNRSEIPTNGRATKMRATISLDREDMEKLNKMARSTGRTRSGLIGLLINLVRLGKGGAIEWSSSEQRIELDKEQVANAKP